jgi:hypothetical protein
LSLAAARDLRVARAPVTAEDLAALETDVLAGFVLARAAAGLSDGTIASDVLHLEQVRAWFGPPLWDMDPPDADAYFGKVLRDTAKGTRLGRFGKLHVRHGKGARGSGPRERMVPLINNAGQTLRWFVEDVWGQFGDDHTRPGVPLLPSERKNADGTAARIGDETLRSALARAAGTHLPDWPDVVTPHVLRHFCASQLYLGGMDLIAIQATLGHAWIATTMQYVHVPGTHIEDSWIAGQQRAVARLKGLPR